MSNDASKKPDGRGRNAPGPGFVKEFVLKGISESDVYVKALEANGGQAASLASTVGFIAESIDNCFSQIVNDPEAVEELRKGLAKLNGS